MDNEKLTKLDLINLATPALAANTIAKLSDQERSKIDSLVNRIQENGKLYKDIAETDIASRLLEINNYTDEFWNSGLYIENFVDTTVANLLNDQSFQTIIAYAAIKNPQVAESIEHDRIGQDMYDNILERAVDLDLNALLQLGLNYITKYTESGEEDEPNA